MPAQKNSISSSAFIDCVTNNSTKKLTPFIRTKYNKSCEIERALENMNAVPHEQVCDTKEHLSNCENSDCCQETEVSCMDANLNVCTDSKGLTNFGHFSSTQSYLNKSSDVNLQCENFSKKTVQELNQYSLKNIQILHERLTQAVEDVSRKLVELLLENDALQEESDARNVAIEQLLKITIKNPENEVKPIKMSVLLPPNDCDDDLC